MLSERDIKAMLYLLDDEDTRVTDEISERLKSQGAAILPYLEQYWPLLESQATQDIIVNLIKDIERHTLVEKLQDWNNTKSKDLLEALAIIDTVLGHNLEPKELHLLIERIRLDAWLELKSDLTSFEKIKILNYVFYQKHGYIGSTQDSADSSDASISQVLLNKKGNPVMLACIYMIVAQRLNIPVLGVNLPQHFVLGYLKDKDWEIIEKFNEKTSMLSLEGSDILFYINPFSNGIIFSAENVRQFLDQINVTPEPHHFKSCDNASIILRVLRHIEVGLLKEDKARKLGYIKEMIDIFIL